MNSKVAKIPKFDALSLENSAQEKITSTKFLIERFQRDRSEWFSAPILEIIGEYEEWRSYHAIAAGTQSAETNEDLAQSEGCQSGAESASPNSPPSDLSTDKDG